MNDDVLRKMRRDAVDRAWFHLTLEQEKSACDFICWLAYRNKLEGGPFDGLIIPERFRDKSFLSIEIGDRVACYASDGESALRFDGMNIKGGEGGTWPDVSADELREIGGVL